MRDYDLFEKFADGFPVWRGQATGFREARLRLFELSKTTKNECFAIYRATKQIVARVNVYTPEREKPFVCQITYDEKLAESRSDLLRFHGYEVTTVFGNGAAKLVLDTRRHCDLFIVGHAAPEGERQEMVAWLKAHYPGVPILALNLPPVLRLSGADYNVKLNGPETLLPVIASALDRDQGSASLA